jgi:hypothetical protein
MPYTYETCHEAFQRGLDDRKAYPLTLGDYKIRETLRDLQRISETITKIAADHRFKVRGYGRYFGCCTSDDAAVWLKRRPQNIAYDLGYYVIPAICALAGDGVPAHIVRACVARANSVTPTIIDDCEEARIALRRGVRTEYTRMKAGQSTVQPLVDAVVELIEVTLRDVKVWIDQGSPEVTARYPAQSPSHRLAST